MKPQRKQIFPKKKMAPVADIVFDYKDTGLLQRYLTERGKIIGRSRTGLTNQQQAQLTQAVKRSRLVALLPFVVRG